MRQLLLAVALQVLAAVPVWAVTVSDDRGVAVELLQPPQRIISLAPHVTELLFEIGAGKKVVGAVDYSDYPEQALDIPRVGNVNQLDFERILALRPDLVVAWLSGNPAAAIARLESLGIPVFVLEVSRLTDIADQLRRLGRLLAAPEQAGLAAEKFEQTYLAIKQQYLNRRSVKVFYEIWRQPLMTLNGNHFVGDALRLCGAVNVFAEQEPLAPTVTLEAVLVADPEIIITTVRGLDQSSTDFWQRWPKLQSVGHNAIFSLQDSAIARPTSRTLSAVERLCALIDQGRQQYVSRK